MKNLIVTILISAFAIIPTIAQDKQEQNLRKSQLVEANDFGPWQTSYPYPFERIGTPLENAKDQAAISTGYYFVTSGDRAGKPWAPDYSLVDTTEDASNWRRIFSGPNQKPKSWFESDEQKKDGYRYFRHLNFPDNKDSVDDVFAGPIPIGFDFIYNGLKYDSFYVFSNGAIMLSNSRYHYDNSTPPRRKVLSNNYSFPNCYNSQSMDWFIRSRFSKTDGTTDPTNDDWGYLMATTLSVNPESNPADILMNHTSNLPVIAPLWGDGYLSQWKDTVPRDRGRVYFYRDSARNKLIVYFVDWQLKGSIDLVGQNSVYTIQKGTTYDPDKMEPYSDGYISANCQIVLDKSDSSISFNYEKFQGRKDWGLGFYPANQIVRFNTHALVCGEARHLDFSSKKHAADSTYTGTLPWAGTYNQATVFFSRYITADHTGYPDQTQSIRFKQWKNTLRVVDLAFRVRQQKQGETAFTEPILTSKAQDFEILAGHEQVGQLQPVAIVQNLTNDIQGPNGVNYQPQDLNFRVRCAIINQATRRPLYNKYVKVDSTAIAKRAGEEAFEKIILSKVSYDGKDYTADTLHSEYYDTNKKLKSKFNGIPPYDFVQIYFPPFEPNDLFLSNIGLMKAYLMIDPTNPNTNKGFGDQWSFDDTLNVRFWTMKHIYNDENFNDDVTEFHVVPDNSNSPVPIPSVFKWVSIGATVVTGESVSHHPLPPRGDYLTSNNDVYPGLEISSPTIKLQRPHPSVVGIQQWGGTEIRSYPIDLRNKSGAVFTFAVQRSTKLDDWERGWSDGTIIGCEHRVVSSDWYNVLREPDELRVEFAKAPQFWRDGEGITNIPEANWRFHLRRKGAATETNMSAFTLFGGGGYMVGFLEQDKDSAMAPPKYTEPRAANGLRYDFYDDGIDHGFKRYYVPIPDTFITAPNEGARYFRFRIKVHAKNNQLNPTSIADDEDPFYIDDVHILYTDCECPDVGISRVYVDYPYTVVPASQATSLPIRLSLVNNTGKQAPSFWVQTNIFTESDFLHLYYLDDAWVWRGSPDDSDYEEMMQLFKYRNQQARDSARWVLDRLRSIYCRTKQMPFLRPGSEEPITMPNWNARLSPPGRYVVMGIVNIPYGDLEPLNDTTYSLHTITFGPMFAQHPVADANNLRRATNDVERMVGEFNKGLNLHGYNMGGTSQSDWMSNYLRWEVGDPGGDGGAGQIAMKFELSSEDTIFGYGAYFCRSNNTGYIKYSIYDGDNLPVNLLPNSTVQRMAGYDEFLDSSFISKEFVFVKLPTPIVLKKGTYWVSIAQLAEAGLELGASKSRSGMRCTNVYFNDPPSSELNGSKAIYLNLHEEFRVREKFADKKNKNFFAYRNMLDSGTWFPFTDKVGNPGYAHMTHTGITPYDNITETYSRGSWIPLLVPYLGNRTYSKTYNYQWCGDPVELTYFRGYSRNGVNELFWETASEIQNHGFYVERRVQGNENWVTMPEFISGHGNSRVYHEYEYSDRDIAPNITYHYRLRQVDLDGTQSCDDFSNIVTLTYSVQDKVALEQNQPNPFTATTTIKFYLPERTNAKLDIVDIFGNTVVTLAEEELSAGQHLRTWNGYDSKGKKVSSGTYIYRLRTTTEVLVRKLIINN